MGTTLQFFIALLKKNKKLLNSLFTYWPFRCINRWLLTEYEVARGILKFQCKTWKFRVTSYSVNSHRFISKVCTQLNENVRKAKTCGNLSWAASGAFGTYRVCEQQRFRRACVSAQSRQNLRCSLILAVSQEKPSDRKPDPWPLWMAGHAQLKFVMTECSKTQIRLTGLSYTVFLPSCFYLHYLMVLYRKIPNYSDTQKICCNHSKIWTMWLYNRVRSPNDADGMANSEDPDQTAPLIWVCTVCSDLSVRKLRIITIAILMKLIPKKQFCLEISTYYDDKKMTKVKKKKKILPTDPMFCDMLVETHVLFCLTESTIMI